MSPRSTRRCTVVAITPFVVEKLIAIVSASHGEPSASRAPVHASTTSSPRWYTASVILEGMGVNITAFTFENRIDFGVHVDPDLVPDPWLLSHLLPDALEALMREAKLGRPTPVIDAFGAPAA